jgi:hypothetical protein
MTEAAFQAFQAQLRQSFGKNVDASSMRNPKVGGDIQ